MNNILKNGEEVLIFDAINSSPELVDDKYIKGVIISSFESDDLSMHGSAWYEQVYNVLGEDEQVYIGTYGRAILGTSYFRTVEDYKKYLNNKIDFNNRTIETLNDRNSKYLDIISSFEKEDSKKYTKTK